MKDFDNIRSMAAAIIKLDGSLGPAPNYAFGNSPEAIAQRAARREFLRPVSDAGEELLAYLFEGLVDDGAIGEAFSQAIRGQKEFDLFEDDLSEVPELLLPFMVMRYLVVTPRRVRFEPADMPSFLRISQEFRSFFNGW